MAEEETFPQGPKKILTCIICIYSLTSNKASFHTIYINAVALATQQLCQNIKPQAVPAQGTTVSKFITLLYHKLVEIHQDSHPKWVDLADADADLRSAQVLIPLTGYLCQGMCSQCHPNLYVCKLS